MTYHNASVQINDLIRSAAGLLRAAAILNRSDLVRYDLRCALEALADADKVTNTKHDPLLFTPPEANDLAIATVYGHMASEKPAGLNQFYNQCLGEPYVPKDHPFVPDKTTDEVPPRWPRDVTSPGPDQRPGMVQSTRLGRSERPG
jgi:hypothetical protein